MMCMESHVRTDTLDKTNDANTGDLSSVEYYANHPAGDMKLHVGQKL